MFSRVWCRMVKELAIVWVFFVVLIINFIFWFLIVFIMWGWFFFILLIDFIGKLVFWYIFVVLLVVNNLNFSLVSCLVIFRVVGLLFLWILINVVLELGIFLLAFNRVLLKVLLKVLLMFIILFVDFILGFRIGLIFWNLVNGKIVFFIW